MTCGTEIVLHLKEDAARYLQGFELERVIRTYSDHILFPIELIDDKGVQIAPLHYPNLSHSEIFHSM